MTYDQVVARFPGARRLGDGKASARCPAHDDSTASLSISVGDVGRTLLHCHAGCTTADVLASVGLTERDLFADDKPVQKPKARIVASYRYVDAVGDLRYEVCRFEPKDFRPRRPGPDGKPIWNLTGVERIPYRLPEVMAASADTTIYTVEGEKDADNLAALGLVATTNPGGCGSTKLWDTRPFREPFAGRHVVILPDNDAPGLKHGEDVARSLCGVAASLKVVLLPGLPPKGDVSDWLAAGHRADELHSIVEAAPAWMPAELIEEPAPTASAGDDLAMDIMRDAYAIQMFADHIRGRALYAARQGVWWRYDDTRWVQDYGEAWLLGEALWVAQRHLLEAAANPVSSANKVHLAVAKKYSTVQGRRSLIDGAIAANLGLGTDVAQFDADPMLLNCSNGTVDLRSGQLRPHNPSDMITKMAPVKFDRAAKCPRWDRFLVEVLPDAETIAFVQLFIGFCLTGSTKNHVVVFLHGGGQNGKSVLVETVGAMLGDYATTLPATVLMAKDFQGHSCELMPLRGARWAVFPELKPAQFDEERVKAFASADHMTARNLYEGPTKWVPTHKMILTGNHKPVVRGQDTGIWRRLKLVPFLREFTKAEQDHDLPAKLGGEHSGILSWALAGCAAWQADPAALERTSVAVAEATAEYRDEMDVLAPFIDDRCAVAPNEMVERGTIYQAYCSWAEQSKVRVVSDKAFAELMRGRGFGSARRRIGDRTPRVWIGVALRGDPRDPHFPGVPPKLPMENISRESLGENRSECGSCGSPDSPDPLMQLGHCLRIRPDTTANDADKLALAEHFTRLNGTAEAAGQRLWTYWKTAPTPNVTEFLAREPKAKGGAA